MVDRITFKSRLGLVNFGIASDALSAKIESFKRTNANHGLLCAINQVLLKAINRLMTIKVLTCIVITEVKLESLKIDSRFSHGFLTDRELYTYALDSENELPEDFLRMALNKGDACYAIKEKDQLAAYGWYATSATRTDFHNLDFCFDSSYVYMYKGLTKDHYRGQRLHAVGMSWALQRYREQGYDGIVSYVESINYDSLKSCYRMGYKKIGLIFIVKAFGRIFHFPSNRCRQYHVDLK